jgi:hypothetical protein
MRRAVIHHMIKLAYEFIHNGKPLVQRGATWRMSGIMFLAAQQSSSH